MHAGARRAITRAAVGAAGAFTLAALLVLWWTTRPLPAGLLLERAASGVIVEDRHGVPLRATRAADGSRHRWLALEQIDPDLIAAFIAAEDRRFLRHGGVDWTGAGRALLSNLRAGRVVSGASTITMQLARLLRPVPRTLVGKVTQVLWAWRLEHALGKNAILEQYLNRVPLGQASVGVDAAAATYFGAAAGELSLAQAATLAAMARAPAALSPFRAPARAVAARRRVLARLEATGYADSAAVARADAEPVASPGERAAFLAPHFTTRLLAGDLGGVPPRGRYRTSLDAALQAELEAEVRHTVQQLGTRGGRHAAVVVLDNPTGEVLAWVGSPDFWSDTAGQVDMVVGRRQPGSALKPFLYALAFDQGYTAATVVPDVPRVFATGGAPYAPRNYDRRFRGPVRLREALASSYNVPAVDLVERVGPAALLATLHRAGFTSLDRDASHYGLGLALGNGEVSLVELANGYRALAAGGRWHPWRWWTGPAAADTGRRVTTGAAAALTLDILADPVARIPGFGAGSPLDLPFRAAVKTGTSRHFTDNWAVATTQGFTVAAWVGNFDGTAMDGVSGVTGAGPLLHRAVLATARRRDPGALPSPALLGFERVEVCRLSGLRATPVCPSIGEWFTPGTAPRAADTWQGPDGVTLPEEYAEWAAAHGLAASARERRAAVEGRRRSPADGATVRIVAPRDGDVYRVPPGVDPRYATLALRAVGGGADLAWTVDGRPVPSGRWRLEPGRHRITAESGGLRHEVDIRVE